MEKLYTFKTFSKMAIVGGCMPLAFILPPGSTSSHELQKLSKKSGLFQVLGTISFVLFLLKGRVKKGGESMTQCSPP